MMIASSLCQHDRFSNQQPCLCSNSELARASLRPRGAQPSPQHVEIALFNSRVSSCSRTRYFHCETGTCYTLTLDSHGHGSNDAPNDYDCTTSCPSTAWNISMPPIRASSATEHRSRLQFDHPESTAHTQHVTLMNLRQQKFRATDLPEDICLSVAVVRGPIARLSRNPSS